MRALNIAVLAYAGILGAAHAATPFADATWATDRAVAANGASPIHRVMPATSATPLAPGGCSIQANPVSLPPGGGTVSLTMVCTTGSPPTTYVWQGPGVTGQTAPQVTTTITSTASFVAFAGNAGGNSPAVQVSVQVGVVPGAPAGCAATISGSPTSVTLPQTGGNVTLAVTGCTPAGVTYSWSRNGTAGANTSATWIDTPGLNPLLRANTTSAARTSSYQVQVCNGAECVTVPAVPLTAVVPPQVVPPTACIATINGGSSVTFDSAGGTAVNLAVTGCTPATGLTYAWTRNGQPASTQQNWTDTPAANALLGPNTTGAARTSSYQVQACNGTACATFPGAALTATVLPPGTACTYSATVNGGASVLLPAAGGPVQLAATATCAAQQVFTYHWSRNGVANVASTATWIDTATTNPLLAANATSSHRISTYDVEICGTAGCVTVPAASPKGTAMPLTALVAPGASDPAAPVRVLEFYHEALDHYFITWVSDEIGKLVAGTQIKGWRATGQSFLAHLAAAAGSSPVCRYYIPPAYGDTHFFGRGVAECTATGQNFPQFVLEDPAFMHMFLPNVGVCPANTTPVYRVFSNRADANHRYMTSLALRAQMVANGWIVEGDGPDAVVMCSPI